MGYLRKRISRRQALSDCGCSGKQAMQGMGDLSSIVSSVENALGTGINVANDPYLPEIVCHIGQLQQINSNQPPGACAPTPDGIAGGVGLSKLVKPFRAYIWFEQNKWAYAVAAAFVIGVPMLIGYDLAQGKKGSST